LYILIPVLWEEFELRYAKEGPLRRLLRTRNVDPCGQRETEFGCWMLVATFTNFMDDGELICRKGWYEIRETPSAAAGGGIPPVRRLLAYGKEDAV
jgi:hypothetical protein